MANTNLAQAARMVRQHLESLHAAGVEWLPVIAWKGDAPAEAPTRAQPARQEPRPPVIERDPAEQGSEETLEQRRVALQVLAQEVAGCQRCPELAGSRTQTVFADGDVGVELCLIGEAPGADEDAQGKP